MAVKVVYRKEKRAWYLKVNHNKKPTAQSFGQLLITLVSPSPAG